ncbi:MAG: hypothetical protein VX733_02400 [Candidatus Latescibacterota bacterium]|nr:hypothetical protein [Candidatus Latescibacterota bacterium]
MRAGDRKHCLEFARSRHPNELILDVMLPKLLDLEVLEHHNKQERTRNISVNFGSAKELKTNFGGVVEIL